MELSVRPNRRPTSVKDGFPVPPSNFLFSLPPRTITKSLFPKIYAATFFPKCFVPSPVTPFRGFEVASHSIPGMVLPRFVEKYILLAPVNSYLLSNPQRNRRRVPSTGLPSSLTDFLEPLSWSYLIDDENNSRLTSDLPSPWTASFPPVPRDEPLSSQWMGRGSDPFLRIDHANLFRSGTQPNSSPRCARSLIVSTQVLL